jgi:hypothetical protein
MCPRQLAHGYVNHDLQNLVDVWAASFFCQGRAGPGRGADAQKK